MERHADVVQLWWTQQTSPETSQHMRAAGVAEAGRISPYSPGAQRATGVKSTQYFKERAHASLTNLFKNKISSGSLGMSKEPQSS
jgi:hypothetical protein